MCRAQMHKLCTCELCTQMHELCVHDLCRGAHVHARAAHTSCTRTSCTRSCTHTAACVLHRCCTHNLHTHDVAHTQFSHTMLHTHTICTQTHTIYAPRPQQPHPSRSSAAPPAAPQPPRPPKPVPTGTGQPCWGPHRVRGWAGGWDRRRSGADRGGTGPDRGRPPPAAGPGARRARASGAGEGAPGTGGGRGGLAAAPGLGWGSWGAPGGAQAWCCPGRASGGPPRAPRCLSGCREAGQGGALWAALGNIGLFVFLFCFFPLGIWVSGDVCPWEQLEKDQFQPPPRRGAFVNAVLSGSWAVPTLAAGVQSSQSGRLRERGSGTRGDQTTAGSGG